MFWTNAFHSLAIMNPIEKPVGCAAALPKTEASERSKGALAFKSPCPRLPLAQRAQHP